MPTYIYINPNNESEYVEIIQKMNENHVYFRDNIQWRREFTVPQGSIDTQYDPFDGKKFAEKTGKTKGTIGDLWSRSGELAEKREKIMGRDELGIKYDKEARARRGGKLPSDYIKNKDKTFLI